MAHSDSQYDTACPASKRSPATEPDFFLISAYFPSAPFCHAGFFRFLIKNASRRWGAGEKREREWRMEGGKIVRGGSDGARDKLCARCINPRLGGSPPHRARFGSNDVIIKAVAVLCGARMAPAN